MSLSLSRLHPASCFEVLAQPPITLPPMSFVRAAPAVAGTSATTSARPVSFRQRRVFCRAESQPHHGEACRDSLSAPALHISGFPRAHLRVYRRALTVWLRGLAAERNRSLSALTTPPCRSRDADSVGSLNVERTLFGENLGARDAFEGELVTGFGAKSLVRGGTL